MIISSITATHKLESEFKLLFEFESEFKLNGVMHLAELPKGRRVEEVVVEKGSRMAEAMARQL